MNTLPHSTTPYDELSEDARTNLLTVVHFALLFREELSIPEHELIFPAPEESICKGEGTVHQALVSHAHKYDQNAWGMYDPTKEESAKEVEEGGMEVSEEMQNDARIADIQTRIARLEARLSGCASTPAARAVVLKQGGRVDGAARLRAGARDSHGIGYVWVRGGEACASSRVVAGGVVWAGDDVRHVAEGVEIRGRCGGGKPDLTVALWLRDRLARAERKQADVMAMWHATCARRREARERALDEARKRVRRMERIGVDDDGCVVMAGERVVLNECGRGRRGRRAVCYSDDIAHVPGELSEEEDEEEEEDDDDEDDGEEFMIDAADADHDDDDDDDDDDDNHVGSGSEGSDDDDLDDDDDQALRDGSKQPGRGGSGRRVAMGKAANRSWARASGGPTVAGRTRVVGRKCSDTTNVPTSGSTELASCSSRATRAARRGSRAQMEV